MREIRVEQVQSAVAQMCQKANVELAQDMLNALANSVKRESNPVAKATLSRLLENARVAKKHQLPLCQDTGLVVVFVELGQDVRLVGPLLRDAINQGVRQGISAPPSRETLCSARIRGTIRPPSFM